MSRPTGGAPVSASSREIARATASRGCSSSTKRSPSASCSVAPSPRIASVTRKPSRPGDADDRGGVELDELEVGELGAGARASSRPEPIEPGGFVVRDHSAAAPPVARITRAPRPSARRRRATPVHAAVGVSSAVDAAALEHVDALLLDDVGRELAQDPAAGRAPARVHDAADAVAALEAEREVAVAVGVEAHAERLEVGEPRRRLAAEHLGGERRTSPRPAAICVREVLRGGVVGGERRGEPALRPVGRGLGERRGGHERDARAGARRR